MLPEKHLIIKRSTLPAAGKGLFTKIFIAKGTRIAEYKGRITTWKNVLKTNVFNAYVYYIKPNHVIDAKTYVKSLARYINDATGISKKKGIVNNTKYVEDNGKVFVEAVRNIEPGEEILVSYGKEYWHVIKYNRKLEMQQ